MRLKVYPVKNSNRQITYLEIQPSSQAFPIEDSTGWETIPSKGH